MSKRSSRNLRIVSSGPESESGGMIAFTREPSGNRASTSGEDSSIRRPTWPTIFVMMRRRCESSVNASVVCDKQPVSLEPDVVRPVDHDLRDRRVARAGARAVRSRRCRPRSRPPAVRGRRGRARPPDAAGRRISDWTRTTHCVAVGDIEETRPELADEREVDPVLDLRERIVALAPPVRRPVAVGQPLVQLHRQLRFLTQDSTSRAARGTVGGFRSRRARPARPHSAARAR